MDQKADQLLGSWASSIGINDIPKKVFDCLESSLLDSIAVAFAGISHKNFKLVLKAINSVCQPLDAGATVFGQSQYYSISDAAFLNGAAIHALDFDDTSFVGVLHPSTVVLPACLALAESIDADLTTFFLAYATGVEAELYFADLYGDIAYAAGHWTTASLGVIGAAIGCGKLLDQDAEQMVNTIRLALQLSMGMRSVHGSYAKAYLAGVAARSGLEAAIATSSGINCGVNTLVGQYGFLELLQGSEKVKPYKPGKDFKILKPGLSYKQYPLCSATQAAIDAVLFLKRHHNFELANITAINCYATDLVLQSLKYQLPDNSAQAQFSMPFALATALINETVDVSHLGDAWLSNTNMRSLAKKVILINDGNLVETEKLNLYPEAARVKISLNDGQHLEHTVLAARGMPINPFDKNDIKKKFMTCTASIMGDRNKTIYGLLETFDDNLKIRLLTDLLREVNI